MEKHHQPKFKFLIPRKEIKQEISIRDLMEKHEEIDTKYDEKLRAYAQKQFQKKKEDTRAKIRLFLTLLFFSHFLVILEMLIIYRIYKALGG